MKRLFLILMAVAGASSARADLMDRFLDLQAQWEETIVDACADRTDAATWKDLQAASASFATELRNPEAIALWVETGTPAPREAAGVARLAGRWQARHQQVLALEMLHAQQAGDVAAAQQWRALIALPRHASAVDGALALQQMGRRNATQGGVAELLAREFMSWQTTRIREKLDALTRSAEIGRTNGPLGATRLAEIQALAEMPAKILQAADLPATQEKRSLPALLPSDGGDNSAFLAELGTWRAGLESALPNLLTQEEVARRERMLLKLLHLIPLEYQAGVRDGEIVVPLEYREAQSFIIQASQLVNELSASWRLNRAEAYARSASEVRLRLEEAEQAIKARLAHGVVESKVKAAGKILQGDFGLSLAKGSGAAIVEETALEVRALLAQSLAAAQAGRWAQAESARLDAYTSFDTAIEPRVLPRAPELGLRAERSFLDGEPHQIGIKAALDRRLRGPEMEAVYQRTLDVVGECQALLKVSVSPATIAFTASSIVMREGLEAVVILAALLAGLRGVANRRPRKLLITGAWCAVVASILTFALSRTLIKSLISYGERLEAVISLLAVFILLMVTNWVFHKVYWVQWNAKLRHLYKAVESQQGSRRWEWLGLVGVGFLTIYREGFETSLFMQSLILEGGVRSVSIGFAIGVAFIAVVGTAIFVLGAKLPYRKLLVITGVLVVSIMITFIGSTVRLFQTVGWLSIHPIPWLEIPSWVGVWFGLYPSWEGMLIPPLGIAYVGAAWLYTKWRARRAPELVLPVASAPAVAANTRKSPAMSPRTSEESFAGDAAVH